MKKYISLLIAAVLIICNLTACNSDGTQNTENRKKLQIVTTIFPEYDWVMNILGKNSTNAEVTMLLDNGIDLHSYQPSTDDIFKISDCDLFIYVGGESDKWVDDALSESENKNRVVISLLDILGDSIKEEEIVEGMESDEDEEEEEGPEFDEHVWLSVRNASILCDKIAEALEKIDTQNAENYKKNAEAYKNKLNKLDSDYKKAFANAKVKTLIFGDRFPFRYLADDYNFKYYAAFAGCSAESEASFETITFLANKVDQYSLTSILTIEGTDHKIAETIRNNTKTKDQKILSLDSMQSTTSQNIEKGTDYIAIMKKNLEVLKIAT